MDVEVRVHPRFSSRVDRPRLRRAARRTLRREKSRTALTIYVTTDAEIRALNVKFHGVHAATDVLSFPMEQASDKPRPYIGDIVISYDRARAQAKAAGWHIGDELDLLAVHGALHLLGYDDLAPRPRARMWRRQQEILGRIAGTEREPAEVG